MTKRAKSILPKNGTLAGNLGKPIKLKDLQLDGVSSEAAQGGQTINIWTRLGLTSDDAIFHTIMEGFSSHIQYCASKSNTFVNLAKYDVVLLIIHPDNTGELWLDTAAMTMNVLAKRSVKTGSIVFENDIADVMTMSFPQVEINNKDRVLCVFREAWRFGLFFDFNPEGNLSIENMERQLGTLHRRLKYRDLYDALSNDKAFQHLVDAGWFPFVEIIGKEFRELMVACDAGFDLDATEAKIFDAFDENRIEKIFARWMVKPHFLEKEPILRSALKNYTNDDPVAVLKIILTEIEGILLEAYKKVNGKAAKLPKLLEFAIESAQKKTGHSDSLLFPEAFAEYLDSNTFANFDRNNDSGKSSSRHAVGHGAAASNSYTKERALQAILTLDQLAFYT